MKENKLEAIVEELQYLTSAEEIAREIYRHITVSDSLELALKKPKISETGIVGLLDDLKRLEEIDRALKSFFYDNCYNSLDIEYKIWSRLERHVGFDDSE